MSLLSKDKLLHLTLMSNQCSWLFVSGHECRFGQFACDITQASWSKILISNINKLTIKFNAISLTFSSDLCRFTVLPAQTSWPEQDVLNYLATQLFKQQYPNYDATQFNLVTDQLRFNQPTLLMAMPHILYQGLNWLKLQVKVNNALPAVIRVWNRIKPQPDQASLIYIEHKLSFQVNSSRGYPEAVYVLPSSLIERTTKQRIIDLQANFDFSGIFFAPPKSLEEANWHKIINSTELLANYHQQLNVMSLP